MEVYCYFDLQKQTHQKILPERRAYFPRRETTWGCTVKNGMLLILDIIICLNCRNLRKACGSKTWNLALISEKKKHVRDTTPYIN